MRFLITSSKEGNKKHVLEEEGEPRGVFSSFLNEKLVRKANKKRKVGQEISSLHFQIRSSDVRNKCFHWVL